MTDDSKPSNRKVPPFPYMVEERNGTWFAQIPLRAKTLEEAIEAVCTAEDRRNALLAQALDLLRLVVIPPMDGSPGHEVAQWLLDQEEAIAFLKKMGQSPKRLSDDDRS